MKKILLSIVFLAAICGQAWGGAICGANLTANVSNVTGASTHYYPETATNPQGLDVVAYNAMGILLTGAGGTTVTLEATPDYGTTWKDVTLSFVNQVTAAGAAATYSNPSGIWLRIDPSKMIGWTGLRVKVVYSDSSNSMVVKANRCFQQ